MKKVVLVLLLFCIFTGKSFAEIGVGVGVGKIRVDEKLKPGTIYNLPPVTVINTGDEISEYELGIEHHQDQKELIPKEEWFIFSPKEFKLEPKKVQTVNVKLNLPVNSTPGDYFAYVEARPIKKTGDSITKVNVAAATKLNFTVIPSSLISAILHKIISAWSVFAPIPQIALTAIIIAVSVYIAKRFINIEIKLSKKGFPRWILVSAAVIIIFAYLFFWIKFFQLI